MAAAARRGPDGPARSFTLAPAPSRIDLGGPVVDTWAYGGVLPGQEIRVRRGEVIQARLTNALPVETSVHWHGIALRNDMDGMPGVTQPPIPAGGEFTYRFSADIPGTYWFHPHTGLQLDRGLYAPLIVEDPNDPGVDEDWVIVLDDWLDGIAGATPDSVYAQLRASTMNHGGGGMSGHDMGGTDMGGTDMGGTDMGGTDMGGTDMGGMEMGGHGMSAPVPPPRALRAQSPTLSTATPAPSAASASGGAAAAPGVLMGARSPLLGGDVGDVAYPFFLINGRTAADPVTFRTRPGAKVRIRFINAGADTAFRVALGGHRLTITHTDGYPVTPTQTDALLIGMGERYDVTTVLADGVFPLVALAEGKGATARALLRTGAGSAPDPGARPAELDRQLVRYDGLAAAPDVRLPARKPDRALSLVLSGGMGGYDWAINGQPFDGTHNALAVAAGERVRLQFTNHSMMWHPMHLHGHTFALGETGPRKDTVAVLPMQTVVTDFDADNPGLWMVHCHNAYHQEAGMMRTLGYLR